MGCFCVCFLFVCVLVFSRLCICVFVFLRGCVFVAITTES